MRAPPPWPRLEGWPERLAALIEARRHLPFAWGSQDCVTLAADAALACCGRDLHTARGRYASEAEAEAILAAAGGLEAWLGAELGGSGAPEIPPAHAQRGDWALVQVGNETLCGPVVGETVAVPGLDRLRFVPLARIRRAWAV